MTTLLRTAIVGTDQIATPDADVSGTAIDDLVARSDLGERETALLLRAGGVAALCRAGRNAAAARTRPEPAATDAWPRPNARAAALLAGLFEERANDLLIEALDRLAALQCRLPEELLPRALALAPGAVRERARAVIDQRGLWLAALKDEWRWACAPARSAAELPADLDARWADGNAGERRDLLALVRARDPARARALVENGWAKEKAEQRLAWLAVLAVDVRSEDEALLVSMLADRSAQVRVAAARALWRIPGSELAQRVRARAESLVSCKAEGGGVLGRVRSLVGARPALALEIELPPETYDAAWEKEGIVETPPSGVGRRQFWLGQMLASVAPDHWSSRFATTPEALVQAALKHDLGGVLIDAWTHAALRCRASAWIAPLWDAWASAPLKPALCEQPIVALTKQLPGAAVEARALAVLEANDAAAVLMYLPRPWPEVFARKFVAMLGVVKPQRTPLLPIAALSVPLHVVPAQPFTVEVAENDYAAQSYARALERFFATVATRRAIYEEIAREQAEP